MSISQYGVVVIDVQFMTNSIVKEIGVASAGGVQSFLIKPPFDAKRLTETQRNNNAWLSYSHHLQWEEGEVEYCDIERIFEAYSTRHTAFFALGQEKCDALEVIADRHVYNLAAIGCPSQDVLFAPHRRGRFSRRPEVPFCICPHGHPSTGFKACAMQTAEAVYNWLLIDSGIPLSNLIGAFKL